MHKIKRDEWKKRVERWRDSGLPAKAFAHDLGIKPQTLLYWSSRLNKESRKKNYGNYPAELPTPLAEVEAGFIEVVPVPRVSPGRPVPALSPFELVLRGNLRLLVPSDFQASALLRLLAALEGR